MKKIAFLKLCKIVIFFLILFGYFETNPKVLIQAETLNTKNDHNISKDILNNPEYILGVGDAILVEFNGLDIFTNIHVVNSEGFINLPELRNLYVVGLTLDDLEKHLNEQYQDYIIDPDVSVLIKKYRPINIFINGEVEIPGLYTLKSKVENLISPDKNKSYMNQIASPPRLVDAIRSTGGLTKNANLSSIEVIRLNAKSKGGGKLKTEINFLKLITEGDQTQNIRLMDGDTIIVKKSERLVKNQLLLKRNNFGSLNINVYMTGNLNKPGVTEIPRGSSLFEAIAAAGGNKSDPGNIEFIRFNKEGAIEKRILKSKSNMKKGSPQNPILENGDLINIRKTKFGQSKQFMSELYTPIITGFSLLQLLNE